MQSHAREIKQSGKKIGFSPTMGFLHDGHLSLVQESLHYTDYPIVSIFVNPTQFGPHEDLSTYPRDFDRDAKLLEEAGVDVLFYPDNEELYPANYQTYINLEHLPNTLCGLSRPNHFQGVATIVCKLFNIVQPDYAFFGEKDYQQLLVIRQMTTDLNLNTEIIGCPIVREKDGLAMSSRNKYLTTAQRTSARVLYQSLLNSKKLVEKGELNPEVIIHQATQMIQSTPETKIDYIKICDSKTLKNKTRVDQPAIMAMAVYVGQTRLIDNLQLF